MTSLNHYQKNKQKYIEKNREYRKTKKGHIVAYLCGAKRRAKDKNLPFDLDYDYLESIVTDCCPIFGFKFVWGMGQKFKLHENPSLDRIVPELGYIKGNVAFISNKANMIKQNVTEIELYAVADWLHDERKKVLNAKKNESTPVSTKHSGKSKNNSKFSTVPSTGPWQNGDDADDYRGAVQGENAYRSAKEGS